MKQPASLSCELLQLDPHRGYLGTWSISDSVFHNGHWWPSTWYRLVQLLHVFSVEKQAYVANVLAAQVLLFDRLEVAGEVLSQDGNSNGGEDAG